MTALEKRSISGLSLIYALRMLGLFMILPVFSVAADQYSGSTPLLVGLAIGAYGLTQAMLQIPFGMLSDRIGRKKVIAFGLLLFAMGSVIAAMADSIFTVILGRLLQGSGAIAAAVMALTADLTRDDHRTKAMAAIGISIGLSFTVALASGAALEHWLGLAGIFWLTAVLAMLGIVVLFFWVPNPHRCVVHRDVEPMPKQFRNVLGNPELMRLTLSISTLHFLLTLSFFALPMALHHYAGIERSQHALLYLPIMLIAFVCMVPFILLAEKQRKMKMVFLGAIVVLGIAQLSWAILPNTAFVILIGLWLFFTAFNILEASLPSMMSKLSPLDCKGTAMGVYSTGQFLGAFLGGVSGGLIYTYLNIHAVFAFGAIVTLFWWWLVKPMQAPRHLSSRILHIEPLTQANAASVMAEINTIPGVVETMVVVDEGVAYVKFSPDETDTDALDAFSAKST
ncbi:MAG: MFS transporter [Methylophaga sp.]|nr:MFS transporter [Methylophaga sp.]